jgi:hypothetical protein
LPTETSTTTSGAEVPDNQPEPSPRFLKIQDVALELATSNSQIYAVLRTGELQGIQIGGRSSGGSNGPSSKSGSRPDTGQRSRVWPRFQNLSRTIRSSWTQPAGQRQVIGEVNSAVGLLRQDLGGGDQRR